MTLLQAMEKTVEVSRGSEMVKSELQKAKTEIKFLAKSYDITEQQAILFSICMEEGPKRVNYIDLARHLDISKIKILSYATDRQTDYESLCTDLQLVLKTMLSQKEYTIITQNYGIGCLARSLSDIGDELGLTRERVRQIRERSIEKIRENPHSKGLMRHFG